jgi:hypothetical protein
LNCATARSSAPPGLSANNDFARGMVRRAKQLGSGAVRRRGPQPRRSDLHDRPQSITSFHPSLLG